MARNKYLAGRLREVYLNGQWIANTNFQAQLIKISWEMADQKLYRLNSIAALTYHINYYLEGLLEAFNTGKLTISDRYSFDLPVMDSGDWKVLINRLLRNAEKFADCVEQVDDYLFDEPFIDEQYGTLLRNIEAVIEHSYYHLGQIVLLKKMLEQT